MSRALLAAALLLLPGCPERSRSVEDDPLITKLKAEQERLARGGLPGGPPRPATDPLAELAQQPPDVPVTLPVLSTGVTAAELTLTPKRLETAQIIAGGKVKLSTSERFVRLVISAATTRDTTLDLTRAALRQGPDTFELARDVQRVGQGSPLAPTLGAGVAQDLVLHFELPPSALGPGLTLVVPVGDATLAVPLR